MKSWSREIGYFGGKCVLLPGHCTSGWMFQLPLQKNLIKKPEIHRAPKHVGNCTLPDITKLSSSESSVTSVLFSNRQYVKSEGANKTTKDLAVSCKPKEMPAYLRLVLHKSRHKRSKTVDDCIVGMSKYAMRTRAASLRFP